ncbi:MAG: hypothetical protein JSU94_12775 [Phycisphaerales bacterium]|nr:MAG: hypothetical protein JSU94_12775 [Phycisphaerales bacterium]
MNKRQKAITVKFLTWMAIWLLLVVGMVNFKDWVNRREAVRAMEQLGQMILAYRKDTGEVPPESYVTRIKEDVSGAVRLGNLIYRALWIEPGAANDTILAYTMKTYRSSLLTDGYIVLFLNGTVKWMGPKEFESLLAGQQSQSEIEMLRQKARIKK